MLRGVVLRRYWRGRGRGRDVAWCGVAKVLAWAWAWARRGVVLRGDVAPEAEEKENQGSQRGGPASEPWKALPVTASRRPRYPKE